MPKRKLVQIEALAFALYLRIKEVRKDAEKEGAEKERHRAKLTVIKGGKPD